VFGEVLLRNGAKLGLFSEGEGQLANKSIVRSWSSLVFN